MAGVGDAGVMIVSDGPHRARSFIRNAFRIAIAGAGNTILQKSAGSSTQPIILIGQTTPVAPPAAASTLVEGFTLRNSGSTASTRSSANSAYRGIRIGASGVSSADPAIIRNCEFLDFSETGIAIPNQPVAYWEFSHNVFDGSRQAIDVKAADFVVIRENTFRDYVMAIRQESNDVGTDLTITGNQLQGGSYVPTPSGYYGLNLSSASSVEDAPKNWLIRDNCIVGSTYGINVMRPLTGAESMADVVVEFNYIDNNIFPGTSVYSPQFAGIWNTSPKLLWAADNYWGDPTGPYHPVTNPMGSGDRTYVLDSLLASQGPARIDAHPDAPAQTNKESET